MKKPDGWWEYEWNGYLFRVVNGTEQWAKVTQRDFAAMETYDGPAFDPEMTRAMANLHNYPR